MRIYNRTGKTLRLHSVNTVQVSEDVFEEELEEEVVMGPTDIMHSIDVSSGELVILLDE